MNDLNHIVSTLSKEDQQRFIHFLEKKNKRNDAKNIGLFKLLTNTQVNSKDLCLKLYGSNNKTAYHALRKRLNQSLIDFTANNSLQEEKVIDMKIIKYILASRTFLHHKQYKAAYKTLDKAELLAKEHHLFPLLNEIYHTKIQYAYTNPELDLNHLIVQFKTNQKNLLIEDQLNIVYAKMRQSLKDINLKSEAMNFENILNKTLNEHHISLNESMSFKSLYQLMMMISISAFVTKDYLKTEPFLIKTYQSILNYKKEEKQPYYHIQILYIIANTLFRNKKFKDSQTYLQLMHEQILLHEKKHHNTAKLKYQLLLALNLNYSNKQEEAIKLLTPIVKLRHSDTETFLDIYLSLIVFNFQKGDYKQAHHLFSKFYHTDTWYVEKAGREWVIKKNLIEILLHLELKNIDLVESRLLSFKRSYSKYLKSINQDRVLTYLNFVEKYYKNPELVTTLKFKNDIENSFKWINKDKEDIFVMSFYAWLKSKMQNKNLYITTLDFVRNSKKTN